MFNKVEKSLFKRLKAAYLSNVVKMNYSLF